MFYSIIKDGVITQSGLPRPTKIGNTYIGGASDIRQFGYYPEVGDNPDAPAGQEAVIDRYEYDEASQVVNRHWKLIDQTAEMIELAREDKRREINAAYQSELDAILRDYPDAETKTWDKQENEARAYQADSTASTPLIDAIATARNMNKAELVQRVIAKADAWVQLSGAATGKRQSLEEQIEAAQTIEQVEAVVW